MSTTQHIALALNALDDNELQELVDLLRDASDRSETLARLFYGADRTLTARQSATAEREADDPAGWACTDCGRTVRLAAPCVCGGTAAHHR